MTVCQFVMYDKWKLVFNSCFTFTSGGLAFCIAIARWISAISLRLQLLLQMSQFVWMNGIIIHTSVISISWSFLKVTTRRRVYHWDPCKHMQIKLSMLKQRPEVLHHIKHRYFFLTISTLQTENNYIDSWVALQYNYKKKELPEWKLKEINKMLLYVNEKKTFKLFGLLLYRKLARNSHSKRIMLSITSKKKCS